MKQSILNAESEQGPATKATYHPQIENAQAYLAAIVTSSTDPIISKTLDGIVISWNASAERMFGYTAEEMIGQSIRRLIPPERQAEEDQILARLKAGERVEHYETVRVTKDGRQLTVSLTSSPVMDSSGKIIGASKIIRDVTERKIAEELLAESETYPPVLLNAWARLSRWNPLNLMVIALTLSTLLRAALTFLWGSGYTFITYYPAIIFSTFLGGWRYGLAATFLAAVLCAALFMEPVRNLKYWTALVIFGGVNALMILFIDVINHTRRLLYTRATAALVRQKGLEAQIENRKKTENLLRETLTRLEATFENAAVGIADVGLDGRWLRVNERLCAIVGYPCKELLAMTFNDITHPDDLEADWGQARRLLAGEIPTYTLEKRYIRKDGTPIWINLTVGLVRRPDGTPDYFISVIEDITGRKQAEAWQHRYAEELAASNAELDAFTYTVSHDLKEPLRGIYNYLHFLQEDEANRLSEEGRHQVATIQRLTQRMTELISYLTEYSRVGRMELKNEVIDLRAVLEQVAETLQPRLLNSGTTLRLPSTLPVVNGDRVRITEVFENLISNAIKYNDKPERWVEVGCRPGNPLVFYVRDNGIGIKHEHQEQIFQIFRRLHGRDAYGGGTGAGLTITKKIIERHGGKIWVESEPGEGSTFYFTLAPNVTNTMLPGQIVSSV